MKTRTLLLAIILFLISDVPTVQEVAAGFVRIRDSSGIIHVFVALCDNENQGIVPVPKMLGNGEDPKNNLYWGALYGVKSVFSKSPNWDRIQINKTPGGPVLERCVFRHKRENVYLVADAYRGKHIKQAIINFLEAASGGSRETISVGQGGNIQTLPINGGSNLVVYVGHDGLMDFQLASYPEKQDGSEREVIVLACASRDYFREAIMRSGAKPLLWTTGLMAPEAYTLESAVEGWIKGQSQRDIRHRAASAYNTYQKCGMKSAKRLFAVDLNE